MTSPLDVLDDAHRGQQVRNAAAVGIAVQRLWTIVDPADPQGPTGRRWLAEVLRLVLAGRSRSGQLAAANSLLVHRLVAPRAPALVVPEVPPANLRQVVASLTVTGPVGASRRLSVLPERRSGPEDGDDEAALDRSLAERARAAMTQAGQAAAAAAARHVQNGGRDLVDEVVRANPRLVAGWARVAREDCCHWCAMLASRGPVYGRDSFEDSDPRFTGPGDHKVHDSCRCTLRQVYGRGPDEWPRGAADLSELWARSTAGHSGKSAVLAFRRAYEARKPPDD